MLDALQEIEIASRLVGFDVDSDDSLDDKYKRLCYNIDPLPHDSQEFELVEKYLRNTHAPTHMDWRKFSYSKGKGNWTSLHHIDRVLAIECCYGIVKMQYLLKVRFHHKMRKKWAKGWYSVASSGECGAACKYPVTGSLGIFASVLGDD